MHLLCLDRCWLYSARDARAAFTITALRLHGSVFSVSPICEILHPIPVFALLNAQDKDTKENNVGIVGMSAGTASPYLEVVVFGTQVFNFSQ